MKQRDAAQKRPKARRTRPTTRRTALTINCADRNRRNLAVFGLYQHLFQQIDDAGPSRVTLIWDAATTNQARDEFVTAALMCRDQTI